LIQRRPKSAPSPRENILCPSVDPADSPHSGLILNEIHFRVVYYSVVYRAAIEKLLALLCVSTLLLAQAFGATAGYLCRCGGEERLTQVDHYPCAARSVSTATSTAVGLLRLCPDSKKPVGLGRASCWWTVWLRVVNPVALVKWETGLLF
jgi:hypothetical protein